MPEFQGFDESVVEVWRDDRDAVFAWAQSMNGERWMHLPGVASYRLGPGADEVTAVPDPTAGSQDVVSGYERTVLPMAVQLGGQEVLHASAVVAARGVVAFCAVATTGKSTIAYEFSRRGYAICADDALAFDGADEAVTALPLPFQLDLRPRSGGDESSPPPGARELPAPGAGLPLGAVCVLERDRSEGPGDAVSVRRLAPAEAFPAVLAHAYCYSLDDVERNRRIIDNYLDLSARVPIFSVVFRAGREHVPALLDAVEEAVGMSPSRTP